MSMEPRLPNGLYVTVYMCMNLIRVWQCNCVPPRHRPSTMHAPDLQHQWTSNLLAVGPVDVVWQSGGAHLRRLGVAVGALTRRQQSSTEAGMRRCRFWQEEKSRSRCKLTGACSVVLGVFGQDILSSAVPRTDGNAPVNYKSTHLLQVGIQQRLQGSLKAWTGATLGSQQSSS